MWNWLDPIRLICGAIAGAILAVSFYEHAPELGIALLGAYLGAAILRKAGAYFDRKAEEFERKQWRSYARHAA